MYCGQCGTRSPGGIRDGGRRSRRALHAADFTDGVRSCHPVASHGVRCPCQVTGRALPCRARRRDILRMTKSQLIQRIADGQSLLAPRDVELAVKMMLEHMTACLAAGDRPSGILWTLTPPAFGTLAARLTPIACTPPHMASKKALENNLLEVPYEVTEPGSPRTSRTHSNPGGTVRTHSALQDRSNRTQPSTEGPTTVAQHGAVRRSRSTTPAPSSSSTSHAPGPDEVGDICVCAEFVSSTNKASGCSSSTGVGVGVAPSLRRHRSNVLSANPCAAQSLPRV